MIEMWFYPESVILNCINNNSGRGTFDKLMDQARECNGSWEKPTFNECILEHFAARNISTPHERYLRQAIKQNDRSQNRFEWKTEETLMTDPEMNSLLFQNATNRTIGLEHHAAKYFFQQLYNIIQAKLKEPHPPAICNKILFQLNTFYTLSKSQIVMMGRKINCFLNNEGFQ